MRMTDKQRNARAARMRKMADAKTDWKGAFEDGQKTTAALRDEVEQLRASKTAVIEQRNMAERGLAKMTEVRDTLAEARTEALDTLRHMQAEALYWRGVACGMDPEKAAAAEAARRGQRYGETRDRMEEGMDRRSTRDVMQSLYDKSFRP